MKHAEDPIPRSYRQLQQDGRRLAFLHYVKQRAQHWLGAQDPVVVENHSHAMLNASFFGATAPVGPSMHIGPEWVYTNVDPHILEDMKNSAEERLAAELLRANHVADQGEQVEFSFSVVVYATARVKAWPDEVPGLTSPPWRFLRNGGAVFYPNTPAEELHRVFIPALLHRRHKALSDGAWRVVLCAEPWTASWVRRTVVAEYFEVVDDERVTRNAVRLAEEVVT